MNVDLVKIKKEVFKAVGKAKEFSGNVVENAKLKIKIAEYKSEINEKYMQIGKLVCETTEEDDATPEIEKLCIEVLELKANITELTEILDKLNNVKKCPQCGANLDYKYVYCPICGYKFE